MHTAHSIEEMTMAIMWSIIYNTIINYNVNYYTCFATRDWDCYPFSYLCSSIALWDIQVPCFGWFSCNDDSVNRTVHPSYDIHNLPWRGPALLCALFWNSVTEGIRDTSVTCFVSSALNEQLLSLRAYVRCPALTPTGVAQLLCKLV